MIEWEKLEHRLTDCNMNILLKDKRIEIILKDYKNNICPYLVKIKENYKCKQSYFKSKTPYWED